MKNKKLVKNQSEFILKITPLPLVPHIEQGKRKKDYVVVLRIPEGTDITKADIAKQKAYDLAHNIKKRL